MKSSTPPRWRQAFALALLPAALACALGAQAASKTYSSLNGGLWSSSNSWSSLGAPLAGDDVFLGSHSASTPDLGQFLRQSRGDAPADAGDIARARAATALSLMTGLLILTSRWRKRVQRNA